MAENHAYLASDSEASPTFSETLTLDQLRMEQANVAARKRDVANKLVEASQSQGSKWLVSSLRHEINQLEFLKLTLAQQEVLLEYRTDLEKKLQSVAQDPASWILDAIDEAPPYSFLLLEKLRDELADIQARSDLFELEIDTAIEQLGQAKHDLEDKQRERRRMRETLQASQDSPERAKVERALVNAELLCGIFERVVQLRKLGLDVKRLEREYQAQQLQTLTGSIDLVAANAPFTQEDLVDKLEEIDRTEAELRHRLSLLHERMQTLTRPKYAADTSHPSVESGENNDTTRDLIRETMSQINESLADLVILRHTWNERFRVENKLVTSDESAALTEQLETFQDRFVNARVVLDLRLKETRLRLTSLNSNRPLTGEGEQLELLSQLLEIGEARAGLLHQADRLVSRFQQDLASQHRASSLRHRFAMALPQIRDWWHYEVLVVDDRPITIGKLCIAALMLLVGWGLSRRLSRMLGKRMLPRFGIHDGASLALQSISFYAMMIICGFVTLDMLNIPLTAFTFLGGATAIAVGFGSQNILNNFMSGLIILGEQPIRVGDLVEIDGLHANIEHIGTRSTRVRTGSNLEIIVPNSRFLEQSVTNWTLSNNEIRVGVKVGVAYGSPVDQVLRLLRQIVEDEPLALNEPEPIVLFSDFADNSLNFEALFWVRMRTHMEGRRVESSVRQRIDAVFREAGITIAFPQRDVHLDIKQPVEVSLSSARETDAIRNNSRAA